MVKVIFHHDTGELLGAHMIGHEVTEMINIFALIKNAELRDLDLIEAIFAHPTLSESIPEAVLSSMMRAIHI